MRKQLEVGYLNMGMLQLECANRNTACFISQLNTEQNEFYIPDVISPNCPTSNNGKYQELFTSFMACLSIPEQQLYNLEPNLIFSSYLGLPGLQTLAMHHFHSSPGR